MDKTQNPNNNEMVIDLVQLAKALWHRAWAIVLAMVIFGGAAFGYARFLITPLYQAGAMMYVVVEELIPEAHLGEHSNVGTLGVMGGFLVMMVLDVALG